MKNIRHYSQKINENSEMPSLNDLAYVDQMRHQQQQIIKAVDTDTWRDCAWVESFAEQFVEDIRKCRLFVDVGAELGFYTYLASKYLPPEGHIIGLEPDPVRFSLLSEFFYGYSNIEILPYAAAGQNGKMSLTKPRGQSATSADVEGEAFTVKTVVLDEIIGDRLVDIIKMDIEGGEADAFKGLGKTLSVQSPKVFLEYHYWVDEICPGGSALIQSMLKNNNYRIFCSDNREFKQTGKLNGTRFYMVPENRKAMKRQPFFNNGNIEIHELVLDFTRLCNSHCTYCSIWKGNDGAELALSDIEKIFEAPQLKKMKSCYVTGGEPYLSDKIIDIAGLLHTYVPNCMMTGATNGIQTEKILGRVLKIREMGVNIEVHVSLNGTESTHDATRGRSGYWEKAVALIDKLLDNRIQVIAAFSMMPQTAKDFTYMRRFCAIRKIPMEFVWVRQSDRYDQVDPMCCRWEEEVMKRLAQVEYLPDFFDCPALTKRLVVTPEGWVYPCEIYHPKLSLGNIKEKSLEAILNDPKTFEIKKMISDHGCTWCQGEGELNGSPKWMIMDCYRRQSPQAIAARSRRPQARYVPLHMAEKIMKEVLSPVINARPDLLRDEITERNLPFIRSRALF